MNTANSELVEVICYDVVVEFLDNVINNVDKQVQALELSQIDSSVFNSFKDEINKAKRSFSNRKITAFQRANITMQAKEFMKQQQENIRHRFSIICGLI